MKRQRIFCIVLVIIVLSAFLAAVYLTFRPGVTIIITGENGSGYHGFENDDVNTSHQSNDKTSNYHGEEETDHSDSTDSNTDSNESDITIEEELPPVTVPDESDLDTESSSGSETQESSSSTDSSEDQNEGSSDKNDFIQAEEIVTRIEKKYSFEITFNTIAHPTDSATAFQDSELAILTAERLEDYLSLFDYQIFSGLHRRGYHVKMTLSYQASQEISVSLSGKTISYEIFAGQASWEYLFMQKTAGAFEKVLATQTNMDSLYDEFTQYNPKDFNYGLPDYSYIEVDPKKTYFCNVQQQLSVANDRIELYALYVMGGISSEYLKPECPLFHKLSVLLSQIETYIE